MEVHGGLFDFKWRHLLLNIDATVNDAERSVGSDAYIV